MGSFLAVRRVQAAVWAISAKRKKKNSVIKAFQFAVRESVRTCKLYYVSSVFILFAVPHYLFLSLYQCGGGYLQTPHQFRPHYNFPKPAVNPSSLPFLQQQSAHFSCFLADVYDDTVRQHQDPKTFSSGRCYE